MTKNIRLGIFFLFTFHLSLFTYAQVNFVFVPEAYGKTVNGLGVFQMLNLSSSAANGNVIISVKENKSRAEVVMIRIPDVTLRTGNNSVPATAFANAIFRFANTPVGNIVSQTRNFPAGDYTYCFRFEDTHITTNDNENCFDAIIQPLVPLTLIYPDDRDTLCAVRPQLSWQPPVPYNAGMRFRLLLTEKKRGAVVENLLMNSPLVLQDNIPSTTINFPSSSPDLKEGKTYCWQVIAHQAGMIVSQSEPWEFTVSCREAVATAPNDSYRELKSLMNGNYYIANRYFKFSFTNNYNVKKLNYSIIGLDNDKAIKRLPEVNLQQGLNKIDIDLMDSDLQTGKHYLLKLYPFNEPAVEVRFVYQE